MAWGNWLKIYNWINLYIEKIDWDSLLWKGDESWTNANGTKITVNKKKMNIHRLFLMSHSD